MYFEIDGAIIEKAALGHMDSFEQIVAAYEKLIFNICLRYFDNSEDAKDVAQEVFIKIFRNIGKYNFSCKFSTWAYKITVNSCIDHLRKMNSRPKTQDLNENINGAVSIMPEPEEAALSKDALNNIGSAIGKLPADYKTMVILRDINSLSYSEICHITQLNMGTVKSRLSRARQRLKEILINEYGITHG